jgi:hypothetical protein
VAFFFLGHDYENLAWDQILKMSADIKVAIYTTVEAAPHIAADYDNEKYPNIAVVPSCMSSLPLSPSFFLWEREGRREEEGREGESERGREKGEVSSYLSLSLLTCLQQTQWKRF